MTATTSRTTQRKPPQNIPVVLARSYRAFSRAAQCKQFISNGIIMARTLLLLLLLDFAGPSIYGVQAFGIPRLAAATIRIISPNQHSCGCDGNRCRWASTVLLSSRGMGMAPSSINNSKTKKSKKNGNKQSIAFGGGGKMTGKTANTSTGSSSMSSTTTNTTPTSTTATTPFDVNASLLRLEKRHEEMQLAATKSQARYGSRDDDEYDAYHEHEDDDDTESNNHQDELLMLREYIVTARDQRLIPDWVPIAQLCLQLPPPSDEQGDGVVNIDNDIFSTSLCQAAISAHCRELHHVAAQGARIFASTVRPAMQYGIEASDSFHKHVYEAVVLGSTTSSVSALDKNNWSNSRMTKAQARQILQLSDENDEMAINGKAQSMRQQQATFSLTKEQLKRRYRTLSLQYHPDRLIGKSDPEKEHATEQYMRIKMAYETLQPTAVSTTTTTTTTTVSASTYSSSWYASLGGRERIDFRGPTKLMSIDAAKAWLDQHRIVCSMVGLDPDLVQSFVTRSRQQPQQQQQQQQQKPPSDVMVNDGSTIINNSVNRSR